jgi:(E)-4-hydroxy-3-methyl-but-2-enyl pyrophosphate reductase (IPP and DMAPP forming)
MSNITVTVAENCGFCFGVRRATETVENAIKTKKDSEKIYTLGRIIHNATYNSYLESCGVITIDDEFAEDAVGENSVIVTRAHGITREMYAALESIKQKKENVTILDCTCPYVAKLQSIAEDNSGENKLFILIGDASHPEVKGVMSHVSENGFVFADADELEAFFQSPKSKEFDDYRVYMAAQTTQNLEKWKKCQENIKKVYTNAIIFDTICSVTEDRQLEAERIAKTQDIMFVIGGRDSSNTSKLNDICSCICSSTFWIESVADIDVRKLKINPDKKYNIGITAGASTPDSIIQEVTNKMNEQNNEGMDLTFEEMLENSIKTLNTGDTVTGVIISISQNEIHLDLGSKSTGVIVHDQITDDSSVKLEELFKVGDEVEAFVIKVSDVDGIATLSKKRTDSNKNWKLIVEACDSEEILEGKIVEAVKGGVIISINSVRVFIPASMSGVSKDGDLQTLVGTTQKVKIVEIKAERKRAYASIRAVQREERKLKEDAFWNEIEEGKQYDGEVKNLTTFGAFVDIGGVDGMVHTSELSWRRIKHPSDVVSVGDKIKVFVKSFDKEKKRISLGYKTEDMDPWFIFNQQYSVGNVATVKIVSLMPFGAFAELVPGVDGLIHISQIARQKIAKPGDVLEIGQEVDARITEIDADNRKVSLSIRALLDEAEEVSLENDADGSQSGMVYSTDNPDAYADFEDEQ